MSLISRLTNYYKIIINYITYTYHLINLNSQSYKVKIMMRKWFHLIVQS